MVVTLNKPPTFNKSLRKTSLNMSAAAGRMASKVGGAATKAAGKLAESGAGGEGKQSALKKGAKKDPELYVYCLDMSTDTRSNAHSKIRSCWASCRLPLALLAFTSVSRLPLLITHCLDPSDLGSLIQDGNQLLRRPRLQSV